MVEKQLYKTQLTDSLDLFMPQLLKNIGGRPFEHLVILSIQSIAMSQDFHLLRLANLHSLVVLDIGGDDDMDGDVDDHLIRRWSRQADDSLNSPELMDLNVVSHQGFPALRLLILAYQIRLTAECLKYLSSFQSLQIFAVVGCRQMKSSGTPDADLSVGQWRYRTPSQLWSHHPSDELVGWYRLVYDLCKLVDSYFEKPPPRGSNKQSRPYLHVKCGEPRYANIRLDHEIDPNWDFACWIRDRRSSSSLAGATAPSRNSNRSGGGRGNAKGSLQVDISSTFRDLIKQS